MFGKWNKIAEGYGKMVLGYFGHTPTAPHSDIVSLASEQLKMEPTTKNAIDIADADETKSLKYTQNILENEGLEVNDENLFIAASCKEKGIAFLKGEAKVNVRKIDKNAKQESVSVANSNGEYTVVVNGEKFNVQVSEGLDASIEVKSVTSAAPAAPVASSSGEEVTASLPGSVFKVVASVGDNLKEGDVIIILEAMKMEIEIVAPKDCVVASINVNEGQSVENGQLLATI
jgi:pyruvate carboxylase subunit B